MKEQEFLQALNSYCEMKRMKFHLKAIFFDMDGVLFDSMPLHAKSWIKTFSEFGLDIPRYEPYMNEGSTAYYTIDKMFRKYQGRTVEKETAEKIRIKKYDYMASLPRAGNIDLMPEFVEHVALNGIDRWVVTGSAQSNLIDRLNEAYNGYFERNKMVTAHEVKIGKPHPEPYLMALEKSGFKANEVMVIENAPLGVESAKAAGLFTIAINTGPLDPAVLKNAGADIVYNTSIELFDNRDILLRNLTVEYI
ncbi:MAG: HAD-IA family hydrolase [Prolixibacteraceae bacterium]|jgi:HAD superfamily hydrolase (TIGR01509 family)|nr:HAD-IA family hydrolase [Prolixibacteraceae bacterium]